MSDPTEPNKKKKPVKLEWQGGLLPSAGSNDGAVRVDIKGSGGGKGPGGGGKGPGGGGQGSAPRGNETKGEERPWKGTARVRREAKGRGGKPVALLHAFTPGADAGQRQWLCRALKEKLACGGTVEGEEVLVQVDDFTRVRDAAAAVGVTVVRAGGFG